MTSPQVQLLRGTPKFRESLESSLSAVSKPNFRDQILMIMMMCVTHRIALDETYTSQTVLRRSNCKHFRKSFQQILLYNVVGKGKRWRKKGSRWSFFSSAGLEVDFRSRTSHPESSLTSKDPAGLILEGAPPSRP